jgi:cell wall-associated NlpC family hydrolase
MLETLPHIQKRQTRRGDLVVFEQTASRPAHVVVLTQGGRWRRDPSCFSHGMPGAYIVPLSVEASYHPGQPLVFLRSVPERF